MSRPRKPRKVEPLIDNAVLVPDEENSPAAVLPSLPATLPKLDADEVDRLCRDAGMVQINGQALKTQAEVVDAIRRSGLITIMSGSVLGRLDAATRLRTVLLRLVEMKVSPPSGDPPDEKEARTAVIAGDVISKVMLSEQASTEQLVKLDHMLSDASKVGQSTKLPPPNAVVNTQVNVSVMKGK